MREMSVGRHPAELTSWSIAGSTDSERAACTGSRISSMLSPASVGMPPSAMLPFDVLVSSARVSTGRPAVRGAVHLRPSA